MKRLMLILMLWPVLALAGTEVHNPTSDVSVQWTLVGIEITHWEALTDGSDVTYIQVYDNDQNGFYDKLGWDDTAISDSTIDSVVYQIRYYGTNVNNNMAVLDSIPGTAIRQSADIGGATAWTNETVMYTTSPSGSAWTWTNIDNLIAGVIAVSLTNKTYEYVAKMFFTVYYHAPTAGYGAQTIMIGGQ